MLIFFCIEPCFDFFTLRCRPHHSLAFGEPGRLAARAPRQRHRSTVEANPCKLPELTMLARGELAGTLGALHDEKKATDRHLDHGIQYLVLAHTRVQSAAHGVEKPRRNP